MVSLIILFCRYNITTGEYPFEGDSIYKLYENIGKGEYKIPEAVDNSLRSLLEGMLQKEVDRRFTLQQIRQHSWTLWRPPKTLEEVPVPPLRGDEWHTMTVLPYLMEHHYGVETNPTYYTEHQLNGQYKILSILFVPAFPIKSNSYLKYFKYSSKGQYSRLKKPRSIKSLIIIIMYENIFIYACGADIILSSGSIVAQ